MTRRWVLLPAALSVVFAGLTVAAALRYLIPMLTQADFVYDGTDQVAIEAYYAWIQSGAPYGNLVPWLATSALIAGVAALALAARRAQLRLTAPAR